MLYVNIGLTEYEGSRTSTNVCLKVTLKWCRLLTKIIFYHLCVSEILTDRCYVLIWIPSDLINTLCWGQRSEFKKKNQEIGEYTKYSIKIKKNKNQYWNSESVKRLSQVFWVFCFVLFQFNDQVMRRFDQLKLKLLSLVSTLVLVLKYKRSTVMLVYRWRGIVQCKKEKK